jgi:hypothetical protein
MKNKATILALLALLGVSLVITGCPHRHRPHVPRPHRPHIPHPLQPVDSLLQLDRQNNVAVLSLVAAGKPAAFV